MNRERRGLRRICERNSNRSSPIPTFEHDGIYFHYADIGDGVPFVFQHGLGGDLSQPLELFTPPPGVRLLCFDFRAHGQTEPLGPEVKISIYHCGDDLMHFLDHLGLDRAVVGGISMGAAVAANYALRYPHRVAGLVLSRPAWLEGPNVDNAARFGLIAVLLRRFGPEQGKLLLQRAEIYGAMNAASPGMADSLAAQFDNPDAAERAAGLGRIPLDAPYESLDQLASISVPTLVLANRQDWVHPFSYGEQIARAIPGAQFHEIPAKLIDPVAHARDVNIHLHSFLQQNFLQVLL